jgi:hypothetical protein
MCTKTGVPIVDFSKIDEVFGYRINHSLLQKSLVNMKHNELAFLGDAIANLAERCFKYSGKYTECYNSSSICSNEVMQDFLKNKNLINQDLGVHASGTVYEAILGSIFLNQDSLDIGLISALNSCLLTLQDSTLDISILHIPGRDPYREKALNAIGKKIAAIYFRNSYRHVIQKTRLEKTIPIKEIKSPFILKKLFHSFVDNIEPSFKDLALEFLNSDIPKLENHFPKS